MPKPLVTALMVIALAILLGQPLPASAANYETLCKVKDGSASDAATFWFDTRSLCAYSGMQVHQGRTYQVKLQVPDQWRWSDKYIPANPGGYECPPKFPASWVTALSTSLRRHPDQPWFQTMARIGTSGDDSYALPINPEKTLPKGYCDPGPTIEEWPKAWRCPPDAVAVEGGRIFNSSFTARSDGPLFFYVNDVGGGSVLGDLLYRNNQGCARVTITESPQ
ncbi:hypothetical protein [Pseudomonas putida]|uniref:hypothetical protein n=1 Tax=Pseudomonas putida TaxID=303 RepID=UPI002365F30B|nr:hypothetical protein [Pseudomonas putida]MDD2050251.1 hypothetical protein [Pseudomonas putida]